VGLGDFCGVDWLVSRLVVLVSALPPNDLDFRAARARIRYGREEWV
jgi:hypothetical protein